MLQKAGNNRPGGGQVRPNTSLSVSTYSVSIHAPVTARQEEAGIAPASDINAAGISDPAPLLLSHSSLAMAVYSHSPALDRDFTNPCHLLGDCRLFTAGTSPLALGSTGQPPVCARCIPICKQTGLAEEGFEPSTFRV